GDKYVGEKFTLSGTTNLAVDDTLIITVTSASFRPTEKTQASEFSGASGTTKVVKGTAGENAWSFDVDTTGFKPDQYIVTVECVETDTRATSTFTVSEVPPTTVTTAPPTTEVTTAPPTTTVPPTTTTPPPTTTPGFGAFIALLGLGAVAVLVLRRH
ncbi:PGF-CTERM sorting domain-containing protein, partial [Methanothrix sp.]|uniref:PGF-CTERM sorting domain-containing protein n=1 Tax=Methanothrix sp. TaxID=90426 RepID=UPI0034E228FD